MRREVTIVDACVRDVCDTAPGGSVTGGSVTGGSPTGVVDDDPGLTDAARQELAAEVGTSHVAFVAPHQGGHAVRFFTRDGELLGCGHGTVAAQALLLARSRAARHRARQHSGGRVLRVVATRHGDTVDVRFAQGVVALSRPAEDDLADLLAALGLPTRHLHPQDRPVVASPGAPRLLVPVATAAALAALAPDMPRLADACRRAGLLGCFVHVPPIGAVSASARMFAPSIGVPEDVANANSTGCLAAHLLAEHGIAEVRCDQGDALGRPSTVVASAERIGRGIRTQVGGRAVVRARLTVTAPS